MTGRCAGVPVSSRQTMVRETVRTYNSRLPAPSIYNGTGNSPAYKTNKQSRPPTRDEGEPKLQREEQVQEILELKKALAKTRQDLQKTRSRRQDRENRSSSDEVTQTRMHLVFNIIKITPLLNFLSYNVTRISKELQFK